MVDIRGNIDPFGLAGVSKEDLLKIFKLRHPYYSANKPKWELYRQIMNQEMTDKNQSLIQGATEHDEDFKVRLRLAVFVPETPMVVQRICGFLSKGDVDRAKLSSDQNTFISKADSKQASLKDLKKEALEMSLFLSSSFMLIDQNSYPVDEEGNPRVPTSLEEQDRMVGLPFVRIYSPFEMVNWFISGHLEWIMIREDFEIQPSPFEKRQQRIVYRIFTKKDWYRIELSPVIRQGYKSEESVITVKDDQPSEVNLDVTSGSHNVGIVPLVPVIPFDNGIMTGEAFIKTAAKLDLAAYRHESDLRFDLWLHAHPILAVKGSSDAVKSLSSSSAIHLNPEDNEDVFYVNQSSVSDIFDNLRKSIKDDRLNVWIQTYQDANSRIAGDEAKAANNQESGIHKRLSFEMAEGAILSHLADIDVEIERRVLEIVARYRTNDSAKDDPDVQISKADISRAKNFDSFWIAEYVKTVVDAFPWIKYSPTLIRLIVRRISRALLDNPDQKTIDTIENEIDGSKGLISGASSDLIAIMESLKAISFPSETLQKDMFREIAEYLVIDDDDREEKMIAIESEIEQAELNLGSEFANRLNSELTVPNAA